MRSYLILVLFLHQIALVAQEKIPKAPWIMGSNANFSFFKGNVNKFDFRFDQSIEKNDTNSFSFNYSFLYSELDKLIINRAHDGSFTFDYHHKNRLTPFTGVFIMNNSFAGFDLRASYFIGLKWRYYYIPEADLSLSIATQIEHVNFAKPPDVVEENAKDVVYYRLSIRPKFKVVLNEKMNFTAETYFQPSLSDFSDLIIQSKNKLSFNVLKHWDLTVEYRIFYNSKPIYQDILKNDHRLMIGIEWSKELKKHV
jgi:hypothetical protein